MHTIYIAGPMTGRPDWNYPAFFEAEYQLRELGKNPLNPAHHDGLTVEEAIRSAGTPDRPSHSWSYYMRRDLPHVAQADALCLLPGWQESRGARLEVHVATTLGIPLLIFKDGQLQRRVTAIGLSGWARSGKDTVADFLCTVHGFTKMSFADPMREALYILNPTIDVNESTLELRDAVDAHGWEKLKQSSTSLRPLMQRLGTDVGRNLFGENVWVDMAMLNIPDGAKAVFADVRFPNEADAIAEIDGNVWRVTRPGVQPANSHISEHALDEYDFHHHIDNAGSLPELYDQVEHALASKGR